MVIIYAFKINLTFKLKHFLSGKIYYAKLKLQH